MKLTVWLRCLGNVYFGYVNRFLVVVGDVTTNELKRQCVGIEKSVGVEWSGFRFFPVTLCERQHVEAFCNLETSKTHIALPLQAWTGP
jgi:hypothetical protein